MEVEVAIRLLYMLAEALPVSHGAHFSGDVTKATALQDMMRTVSMSWELFESASKDWNVSVQMAHLNY